MMTVYWDHRFGAGRGAFNGPGVAHGYDEETGSQLCAPVLKLYAHYAQDMSPLVPEGPCCPECLELSGVADLLRRRTVEA